MTVSALVKPRLTAADVAAKVAPDLVKVTNWGQSSFVNLPLFYPSGSHVTVKLDMMEAGIRVSDNAFAYREVEAIGAERSFARTARATAAEEELGVEGHVIFADATADQAVRAICDVAIASWRVVDQIYSRQADEDQDALEEHLKRRLPLIFADRLEPKRLRIQGASTTEWEVAGIVRTDDGLAVFSAVANHHVSINNAVAAFVDLSNLDHAPRLIGVVSKKAAYGSRLALLSEAGGRVIEEGQADEVYLRAAA